MRSLRTCCILVLFLYLHFNLFSQTITIDRKSITDNCIMGYLIVDKNVVCYTLELPYIGNIPNISTIPAGTYIGKVRVDGKKGWRIELQNVPGRTNVQIHVGNYTNQIQGCTLIGTNASVDNCTVLNSRNAREIVRTLFLPILDQEITVVYRQ